jgi:hypothetical protein
MTAWRGLAIFGAAGNFGGGSPMRAKHIGLLVIAGCGMRTMTTTVIGSAWMPRPTAALTDRAEIHPRNRWARRDSFRNGVAESREGLGRRNSADIESESFR